MTHIVAHVRSNEWADTHPRFLEQLYLAMQHLCAELFFSRTLPLSSAADAALSSKSGPSKDAAKPIQATGSLAQLQKSFDSASSATSTNAVGIYNQAVCCILLDCF